MDNAFYVNLVRMKGLRSEMRVIANNIANTATNGFKKEGLVFSEYISALEEAGSSLSMATPRIKHSNFSQGALSHTGAPLDFAIEGDGFFLIEFGDEQALTRAGSFQQNDAGDGHRLLDAGGAPVFLPPDARSVKLSSDGALSADGVFLTEIGLYQPAEGDELQRQGQTLFQAENAPEPVEVPMIRQGFQEDSNVQAILEVARMLEVQRAYERGAKLNQDEHERIRTVLRTLSQQ